MDRLTWTSDRTLDFARSMGRYTRWGLDPVNVVTDAGYHRVTTDGTAYRAAPLPVDDEGAAVAAIELLVDGDPDSATHDFAHRVAEALDPGAVDEVASRVEAVGAQRTTFPGYRPPFVANPFEALITSITAQQVNLTWATTTRRRLVEAFGTRHDVAGTDVWAFPTPARLAEASVDELRELQFTTSKSEYLIGVAEAALAGTLDDLTDGERAAELSDDEVIAQVTAIRGVGRWTADWLLARCLGRPHVVAAGDLAVRKAISWFVLDTEDVVPEATVREVVADWGDGANWATHLLLDRLAT